VTRVLLFGGIREIVGGDSFEIEIGEGATTGSLLDALALRHPAVGGWRPFLRVAVNREYVPETRAVLPGDEIAIIPPVSGG